MTCECGHDRDFFHGGGNGCRIGNCDCTAFRNGQADDHLTDLMDAVIA